MRADDKSLLLSIFHAALVLFVLVGLAGCGKNYSRDQFTQMAMHKTEAEVRGVFGEPSWISDGNPKTWIYYHKTFDVANQNKDDYKASLKFAPDAAAGSDKVVNVEFAATAGS